MAYDMSEIQDTIQSHYNDASDSSAFSEDNGDHSHKRKLGPQPAPAKPLYLASSGPAARAPPSILPIREKMQIFLCQAISISDMDWDLVRKTFDSLWDLIEPSDDLTPAKDLPVTTSQ